jgi:hypothetical protein
MNPAIAQLLASVRTQLDAAGVVFWLLDAHGACVATTTPASWLWESGEPLDAARNAARSAGPGTLEILPGLWACASALSEPCRGMTIVLAAGTPAFAEFAAPRSGGHDAGPLAPFARFEPQSAQATLTLATAWIKDACTLSDHRETIAGFTTQLSQAFDNIDCLYALGRAMHDPTKPKEFLRFVCDRLRSSTDFAWVAARFTGDDDDASTLTDRFYLSGTPSGEISDVVRVSGELARADHAQSGAQILEGVQGLSIAANPQVLLHPIQHGVGPGGALFAGEKGGPDHAVSSWDIQLFEAAAGFITSYLENVALFEEQRRLFLGTVQALTAAIDAKDRYTRGHSERVAHLSSMLAREIGLSEDEVERIRIAGLVHDVGKIGVPEAVLTKQGKLTEAEFDAIKRHPQIGYGILQDIPPLQDVLPGVLHHHERWDGRGYPSGLAGEQIPLQARIIAVADTFDAMSSTRSYRPAMPREKVLAEMRRCAGSQFDAALVPAFLRISLATFDRLVAKHAASEIAPPTLPEIPDQKAA